MTDPLPNWNEGPAKRGICDFVSRVTDPQSNDFVPEPERIATFDNDGTLWCEQPIQVQVFFLIDRVKALVESDSSLADQQPYKALLERDLKTLCAFGKGGLQHLFAATHAGMTETAFATIARDWQAGARHPSLDQRFVDLTYQPQLELLDYLLSKAFRCFIVTGGGVDFVRGFAQEKYGIPPERVIGSSQKLRFDLTTADPDVLKLAELACFNDRQCKPENIALHIGRRPILAFGNSDGDLAMLSYVSGGAGPRLAMLLHHDDGEREFAYDRDFALSPLAQALDQASEYGITVVSMARDWATVFRSRRESATQSSKPKLSGHAWTPGPGRPGGGVADPSPPSPATPHPNAGATHA